MVVFVSFHAPSLASSASSDLFSTLVALATQIDAIDPQELLPLLEMAQHLARLLRACPASTPTEAVPTVTAAFAR